MRKKIVGSVAFLLGLAMLLLLVSRLMRPKSEVFNVYGVETKLNELAEEPVESIDVVFFGDSEAYASFNPLQMYMEKGISSYVCGTSLQKLCDTYVLMEKAYDMQTPDVVILEANCFFRQADIYADDQGKLMNAAAKLIPVIRYHNIWKSYIPMEKIYKSDDRRLRGFRYRPDVKPYKGGEWMNEADPIEEVSETERRYIRKIYDYLFKRGVSLVLVSTPSPENWSYGKHLGVTAVAEELGVPYIDMNLMCDELAIDWSVDTKDEGNHLNYSGAKKVTSYIGQYLWDNFELTDHRGDELYERWKEDWDKSGMEL